MDFGIEIVMEELSTTVLLRSPVEISAVDAPVLTAIRKSLVLEALRHCEY